MKKTINIMILLIVAVFLVNSCAKTVKEAEIQGTTGAVKEFTMKAKRVEFAPSTITVNKGDKVKITITSIDAVHGFLLLDFNINEKLEPNKPVTVEFLADKAGTFAFKCSVPCGSGHINMSGNLIVN